MLTDEDERYRELFEDVCVAFTDMLYTTIHEARKPSGRAKAGRVKAYAKARRFARKAIKFGEETG